MGSHLSRVLLLLLFIPTSFGEIKQTLVVDDIWHKYYQNLMRKRKKLQAKFRCHLLEKKNLELSEQEQEKHKKKVDLIKEGEKSSDESTVVHHTVTRQHDSQEIVEKKIQTVEEENTIQE